MQMEDELVTEDHPPAAAESAGASSFTIIHLVYSILASVVVYAIVLAIFLPAVDYAAAAEPRLFIRLVEAEGLGLGDPPSVPEVRYSPVFVIAVDADPTGSERCVGGGGDGDGDAMLRVSYRGIILAWGAVPRFCIGGTPPGASVVATAEGSVLREELRSILRAEIQTLGKVEFRVEGGLPGLGYIRCKTYLFQGELTEPLPPCLFQ